MHESHLERKLKQLGLTPDGVSTNKKLTFKLYFPRPPYAGVEYQAAKQKDGYNFVGLILGHGGSTLQRIQKQSGTKIEIHDENGNLNGAHPVSPTAALHAFILGDSLLKLERAAEMIKDVLQPTNSEYASFTVKAGGQASLRPATVSMIDSSENNSSNTSSEQDVPYISKPPALTVWDEGKMSDDCGVVKSSSGPKLLVDGVITPKPTDNVWNKNSPWSRSSASSQDGYTPQVAASSLFYTSPGNDQTAYNLNANNTIGQDITMGNSNENLNSDSLNLGWTSWDNTRNFLYDSLATAPPPVLHKGDALSKSSNSNSAYTSFTTTPAVSIEESLGDVLASGQLFRNVPSYSQVQPAVFPELDYLHTKVTNLSGFNGGSLYYDKPLYVEPELDCDTNVDELVDLLKVPLS